MPGVSTHSTEEPATSHRRCFVCGTQAANGLHADFRPVAPGRIEAVWDPAPEWAGYDGILHGGISAALLDDAMVHALFSLGITGFTAAMELRYLRPVHIDATVTVTAWRTGSKRRLHQLQASLVQHRMLCVRASARFMESPAPATPSIPTR